MKAKLQILLIRYKSFFSISTAFGFVPLSCLWNFILISNIQWWRTFLHSCRNICWITYTWSIPPFITINNFLIALIRFLTHGFHVFSFYWTQCKEIWESVKQILLSTCNSLLIVKSTSLKSWINKRHLINSKQGIANVCKGANLVLEVKN